MADLRGERRRLRTVGPQRRDLGVEPVRRERDRAAQLVGGRARRLAAVVPEPDRGVDVAPPSVEVGGDGRVPELGAGGRRHPSVGGPAGDGAVVGVAGHAVGSEGDDDVGSDGGDVPGDGGGAVSRSAGAVLEAEHVGLVDADRRQAAAQLAASTGREPSRWPSGGVVGAVLAEGGGHDDDPVAAGEVLEHEPSRQEGLVVGVGPHPEERAAGRSVGGGGHRRCSWPVGGFVGGINVRRPPRRDIGTGHPSGGHALPMEGTGRGVPGPAVAGIRRAR